MPVTQDVDECRCILGKPRSGVIVMPTGAGKIEVALLIVRNVAVQNLFDIV